MSLKRVQIEVIAINEEIFIVSAPEKLSLSSCYNFERVDIDDCINLFVFEAYKLRDMRIRLNFSQLGLDRHCKLYGL